MLFLTPNQQCKSIEGSLVIQKYYGTNSDPVTELHSRDVVLFRQGDGGKHLLVTADAAMTSSAAAWTTNSSSSSSITCMLTNAKFLTYNFSIHINVNFQCFHCNVQKSTDKKLDAVLSQCCSI